MHRTARPTQTGPGYLLQGLSLLNHPKIRWFVMGPMVINALLFIALTWFAIEQFGTWLDALMAYIPSWLEFLTWFFWVIFAGLLFLIYGYSFAILGNILASPFYGPLAERTASLLTGNQQTASLNLKQILALAARSVKRELIKLGYFLPRIIGVLLLTLALSLIPVLNLIGPVIAFFWGAWSLALQYVDYPADNHQVSFDQLRETLSERKGASISFGGCVLIATTIPVLNLFTMPASVIGATAFWLERVEPKRAVLNKTAL